MKAKIDTAQWDTPTSLDQLLAEVKGILTSTSDLNAQRDVLEQKMEELMTWKSQHDEFEVFFNDFSDMISGMHQLNFSHRLPETDNKKSFLNFIAHSLNAVNEELEQKVIPIDFIDFFRNDTLKNHLCFITTDKFEILHPERTNQHRNMAFNSIGNVKELLSNYKYFRKRMKEYNNEIVAHLKLRNREHPSTVRTYPMGNRILFIISLYPQNKLEEQLPRMLELVRLMKVQLDNNPEKPSNIIDITMFRFARQLYYNLNMDSHSLE